MKLLCHCERIPWLLVNESFLFFRMNGQINALFHSKNFENIVSKMEVSEKLEVGHLLKSSIRDAPTSERLRLTPV